MSTHHMVPGLSHFLTCVMLAMDCSTSQESLPTSTKCTTGMMEAYTRCLWSGDRLVSVMVHLPTHRGTMAAVGASC